jgi:DHA2 family multidrug resistance protein
MMAMMAVAGRTVGKMDPRLMVCLAYIATALGVFNLSQLDLTSSFGHITELRILQVIALPFVFIPISTLNYVGVPATKTNQISSLSNVARNLGGSAGTALLTTYIARSTQVHQAALAANVVPGTAPYDLFMDRMKGLFMQGGMSSAAASQAAVGEAYQMMVRQATMLSYKGAFTILGCAVVMLSPLPFLMRLPPKRPARPGAKAAEPAPEELAVH